MNLLVLVIFLVGLVLALAGLVAIGLAFLALWRPWQSMAWLQKGHRVGWLLILGLLALGVAIICIMFAIMLALLAGA